jgi:hypothetical protein
VRVSLTITIHCIAIQERHVHIRRILSRGYKGQSDIIEHALEGRGKVWFGDVEGPVVVVGAKAGDNVEKGRHFGGSEG